MKKLTLAIIGALLLTGSLLAHHGWGGIYDLHKQVLLKVRVVKVTFRNPHSTLTIETKNSGIWEGEWTSWDGLTRHGIREDTIKVGDSLEILGSPSRVLGVAASLRRMALDEYRCMARPASDRIAQPGLIAIFPPGPSLLPKKDSAQRIMVTVNACELPS
jgi:hypothetical protein